MSDVESRDVADICKKILDIVPDSEIELLYQVRTLYESLWNKAPEIRKGHLLWKYLGNILNKNIDSVEKEWQQKIVKLFNDE